MKYAVYLDDGEPECQFFRTEQEAHLYVATLIVQTEDMIDEDGQPDWDITLMKVIGEVQPVPFDGAYRLKEVV